MSINKLYVLILTALTPIFILSACGGGGSGDGPYIHDITFSPESPVPKSSDVLVTADVEGTDLEFHWTVQGGILRSANVHNGQAGAGLPKIGVTPSGHDDAGEYLDALQLDYDNIGLDHLDNSTLLDGYDAIFINSSDEISVVGTDVTLMSWVNKGGALYASGTASDYLDTFGVDGITFAEPNPYVGSANSMHEFIYGKVTDESMQEGTGVFLIDLEYPDYRWTPVIDVDWPVQTLIEADTSWVVNGSGITNLPNGHTFARTPMTVSIPYGAGEILYTSVHDHPSMSLYETAIQTYMVARTAAWCIKKDTLDLIQYTGFYPYLDFIGVMAEDDETEKSFELDQFDDVMIVLNAATGVFNIQVDGPGGISEEYTTPVPISMVFSDVEPGEWTVNITADNTTGIEMVPYVLAVGYRSDSFTFITQTDQVIWTVPAVEDIYTINLEIFDNDNQGYSFLAGVKVE